MRVYRIENHRKYGPFNAGHVKYNDPAYQNPPPYFEAQNGNKEAEHYERLNYDRKQHYRFGFADIPQLRDWFSEDALKKLQHDNFYINCYEVPSDYVFVMGYQVTFDIREATLIEFVPYEYVCSDEVYYEAEFERVSDSRYQEGIEIPSESQAV